MSSDEKNRVTRGTTILVAQKKSGINVSLIGNSEDSAVVKVPDVIVDTLSVGSLKVLKATNAGLIVQNMNTNELFQITDASVATGYKEGDVIRNKAVVSTQFTGEALSKLTGPILETLDKVGQAGALVAQPIGELAKALNTYITTPLNKLGLSYVAKIPGLSSISQLLEAIDSYIKNVDEKRKEISNDQAQLSAMTKNLKLTTLTDAKSKDGSVSVITNNNIFKVVTNLAQSYVQSYAVGIVEGIQSLVGLKPDKTSGLTPVDVLIKAITGPILQPLAGIVGTVSTSAADEIRTLAGVNKNYEPLKAGDPGYDRSIVGIITGTANIAEKNIIGGAEGLISELSKALSTVLSTVANGALGAQQSVFVPLEWKDPVFTDISEGKFKGLTFTTLSSLFGEKQSDTTTIAYQKVSKEKLNAMQEKLKKMLDSGKLSPEQAKKANEAFNEVAKKVKENPNASQKDINEAINNLQKLINPKEAAKEEVNNAAKKAQEQIDQAKAPQTAKDAAKEAVKKAADKANAAIDQGKTAAEVEQAKEAGLKEVENAAKGVEDSEQAKAAAKEAVNNAAQKAQEQIDQAEASQAAKDAAKEAVKKAADKAKAAIDQGKTAAEVEQAKEAGLKEVENAVKGVEDSEQAKAAAKEAVKSESNKIKRFKNGAGVLTAVPAGKLSVSGMKSQLVHLGSDTSAKVDKVHGEQSLKVSAKKNGNDKLPTTGDEQNMDLSLLGLVMLGLSWILGLKRLKK